MRQYLPTNDFVYKNIQTDSEKKVVFLSGMGLDIRKQREGFFRRNALLQEVSYLALDYTAYTMKNRDKSDFNIGQSLPQTIDTLMQDDKKLFLCGLCYGGLMALKIAAQIPERIGGIVALSPPFETETFPWLEKTNNFLKKREEMLKTRKTDHQMLQQMILFREIMSIAIGTQGREKIEPTFQGPIHIFHGEKDRLIPVENSIHVQRALNNPNCALHISPMTGHALNNDFEMKALIRALNDCLIRG